MLSLSRYSYLDKLLQLALPFALQELLVASLQVIDNVMLGKLHVANVAAVSLAGQPFFIFILLLMGITSGSSVFVAQYWGKRDVDGVGRSFGISLGLSLAAGLLFSIGSYFFATELLSFFTDDSTFISVGASYLRIIAPSYFFIAATISLSSVLRSTAQPQIPLLVSSCAIVINTVLNYVLIFGKFGFPRMGVEGAALGTLIARGMETLLLFGIVYGRKNVVAVSMGQMLHWPPGFIRSYVHTALPVLANDLGWGSGFALYSKIFARVGAEAYTAVSILHTYTYLFLIFFMGTGHATAVILGNQLGNGDLEESKQNAHDILLFVVGVAGMMGFGIIWVSPYLTNLFTTPAGMEFYVMAIAAIWALSFPFKVINMHVISGVLRSGGDTKFGALLDIIAVWCIGLPLGGIAAYIYGADLTTVYGLILLEEGVKAVVGIHRMKTGIWLKTLV